MQDPLFPGGPGRRAADASESTVATPRGLRRMAVGALVAVADANEHSLNDLECPVEAWLRACDCRLHYSRGPLVDARFHACDCRFHYSQGCFKWVCIGRRCMVGEKLAVQYRTYGWFRIPCISMSSPSQKRNKTITTYLVSGDPLGIWDFLEFDWSWYSVGL